MDKLIQIADALFSIAQIERAFEHMQDLNIPTDFD